ncbi:hypothetical protein [Ascidiimonas sp. W6]|uniref:hypothetical protein n=1 Tax=Ascidiimonas meishanensis TaxID=3128903 RepID=UPI0030EE6790
MTVAKAASENPNWKDYADYCLAREKGLRKKAFKILGVFIKSTQNWTTDQKIEFTKFLFCLFENVEDIDYCPFPQPLSIALIKPTLEAWCKNEKTDHQPFRWYGKYYRSEEHLFKAIKINPEDDLAREIILNRWAYNIYYSIHHLPEGYIGNPANDTKLAKKIKEQIAKLTNPERKDYWVKELKEDLEIVENYIAWKKSGHQNLAKWGKENHKIVGYNLT